MSGTRGERFHVGTRKGIFTVAKVGGAWQVVEAGHVGDNVPIVMHDPRDDTLYAALDHGHFGGKLHRRPAGGGDWEEIGVPTYPDLPEGVEEDTDASGRVIPWTLKLVWSLVPGLDDQPGRLWCGTLPGGLFRSDDRGDTWELVRGLWDHPDRKEWMGGGADWPGVHSIAVHPTDGDRLTVGVSCGGIWVTEDGGASWACRADGMRAEFMPPDRAGDPRIQDPHCLVQCVGAPDRFWVQHHNAIYRSVDDCASWQEVEGEPTHFGFAVSVHPEDPETAWFVPAIKDEHRVPQDAHLVVSRTRDGGETFDVLRNGLPQEHAYDLVLRHAMDLHGDGRCLAFGSTTGNVFVSEDQGDSWTCVSTHLPPVYCVRWEGRASAG